MKRQRVKDDEFFDRKKPKNEIKNDKKRKIDSNNNTNKRQKTIQRRPPDRLTDPVRDTRKFPEAKKNLLKVGPAIVIKKFPIESIKVDSKHDGKRVLIIGMSGSGKSTSAIEIIRANRTIPLCRVISETESRNHTFGPYVHPLWISDELKLEYLEAFKRRQIETCEKWQIPNTKPVEYYRDPSAALILDDCGIDDKLFKEDIFKYLFFNSRHDKVLFVMLMQYFMMVPIHLRRNVSHLFIFRQNAPKEIKKIYSEFAGVFNKEADFVTALELCTANYGCMVIDCVSASNVITDRVFFYRAKKQEDQEPFEVGAPWSLAQADEMYNKLWKKQEEKEKQNKQPILTKKSSKKEPLVIELDQHSN